MEIATAFLKYSLILSLILSTIYTAFSTKKFIHKVPLFLDLLKYSFSVDFYSCF